MCGVAGLVRFEGPLTPVDVRGVVRMLDAQVHRGPDDWGLLLPDTAATDPEIRAIVTERGPEHLSTYAASAGGPSAVLGSRRLAIRDLSPRGRMPMGSPDGRVWVTYNGEVYNAAELRAELGRLGFAFRSDADTEVIVHGYRAWGDGVVERLRGMFALALLDAVTGRLLLARDRFGIKPLYVHDGAGRLLFASEVGALRRSGAVHDALDREALVAFLEQGSVPGPLTTLAGARSLESAHTLVADASGRRRTRYWDLAAFAGHGESGAGESGSALAERSAAHTRGLLEDAVARHMVSDVPLGVFLSGGIDSSSLVALASRRLGRPLVSVSLVFEESAFSEAPYARLVADRFGTRHHEVLLRAADVLPRLPDVLDAMDQPSVDGVNAYFVSRAARDAGLTVALSGAGADELFLGYPHFARLGAAAVAQRALGVIPPVVRTPLLAAASRLAASIGLRGAAKLAHLGVPHAEGLYRLWRGLFTGEEARRLVGVADHGIDAAAGPPPGEGLDAFVRLEVERYLQNQILRDADVMGMAHSIEVRVPFLDHPLAEYVYGTPAARRLSDRVPKRLLVEAMGDDLPDTVWNRPKMGFTLPFDAWLRADAPRLAAATREAGLLDAVAVDGVWRDFLAGRRHWSRPWALVVASNLARRGQGVGSGKP